MRQRRSASNHVPRNGSTPVLKRVRFVSTCPVCGAQRLQLAYTRRALLRLLENANTIDAYCLACDVVWPVNVQERNLVAAAIAAGQLGATATGSNSAAPLS